MNNEKAEVKISINKKTLERLEKTAKYYNSYSEFYSKEWTPIDTDDLLIAAVERYVEVIDTYYDLSRYGDLSKPFKIKNRFKDVMKEKGLSQTDLAKITGLNNSNISNIVSNRNQPSLDHFFRVWVALNCPSLHEVLYRESE